MGLETATYVKDLVPTNPTTSDFVSQGDDHIRMLKSVLQSTFPSLCGPGLPTVGGTANAITLTYSTAPGSNLPGEIIYFTPTAANTGPTTISVNGNTALSLFNQGVALVGGELKSGVTCQAMIGANGAFNLIANGSLPLSGGTLTGALALDGTVAAGTRYISGRTSGSNRWVMYLGGSGAESGGNVGSDFQIQRYSDAGTFIDQPLTITRSSGAVALRGTQTNDSAAAGMVGEFFQVIGSSTAVTSNNPTTIAGTQIVLTAGDWEVWGTAFFSPSGSNFTGVNIGIGTTLNVLPGTLQLTAINVPGGMGATVVTTPLTRFSVAASQNVFLTVQCTYPSGSAAVVGNTYARRMR
jgi:hypothetical protein